MSIRLEFDQAALAILQAQFSSTEKYLKSLANAVSYGAASLRKRLRAADDAEMGWPKMSPVTRHIKLHPPWGKHTRVDRVRKTTGMSDLDRLAEDNNKPAWGKLRQAIAFRSENAQATIGILPGYRGTSSKAGMLAEKVQTGFRRRMTWKMHKYFRAIGIFLPNGALEIPPRPLFGPVYEKYKTELMGKMLVKIQSDLTRDLGTAS